MPPQGLYLGIDPGANGGLAVVGSQHYLLKMPAVERDVWIVLKKLGASKLVRLAVIEQQTARPTSYFDQKTKKWISTILASTCTLYGSYMQLRAMLCAADIPYDDCPPKRWQKGIGIPERDKSEDTTKWKNRLKAKAQALYPDLYITLATADAVLLASYAMRLKDKMGGTGE